jgi:alanine racemase
LSDAAGRQGKKARVHFKINTGMNRYGSPWEQALETIRECCQHPHLEFVGVMTHFPLSDAVDKSFALLQIMRMHQVRALFEQNGIHIPTWHMCNSGGVLDLAEAHMDMVRCGLMLYGYYPSQDVNQPLSLKPAMTVKTHIIAVRNLTRGDSVGYGRRYMAEGPERIAVLPIGYADGYDRKIRKNGTVLLNGRMTPIISGLCMDACFIKITDFPEAKIGDPVTIMGREGNLEISPHDIAGHIESVSYEVMARFGKRLPRVYYKDGRVVETINNLLDE